MDRLFVFLMVSVLIAGCQFNRSFVQLSPTQILGSERGRQGIAAMERGDLNEAEKRLEDAVKLSKNDTNHRRYYAEVLWQQGKHQEALQQLGEAIQRGGQDNASLHLSLAEKYLIIQDYPTAYQHADEAVRLASQESQSWALRGRVRRLQAERLSENSERVLTMFHQSREDFLRAVSLSPNDRELLPELAAVQMRCGQNEQALATWLSVQSLYPQGGEPTEVLLGKANTFLSLRRFDEAVVCLTDVRQREPNDMETARILNEILAARNSVQR
jgi:tetratricopeptide (TPR) repeat protein